MRVRESVVGSNGGVGLDVQPVLYFIAGLPEINDLEQFTKPYKRLLFVLGRCLSGS
jgi:hypothetical protein